MRAIATRFVGRRPDGKRMMWAMLLASSTPMLPSTGADVPGMDADVVFAPFSIIYVAGNADAKVYVADESGIFKPQ